MTNAPDHNPPQKLRWSRYHSTFIPAPPGPSLYERLKGALGAVGGIAVTGLLCGALVGSGLTQPLLVAPMGASAVLLFAVPASPLAQPWPILGGNVISALIGVAMVRAIPDPTLAAAAAVGIAIAIMSLLRCLHPPGGAVALSAVLSGSHGAATSYLYAFIPVGLNSLLLLAAAYIFHRFSGHSYPHVAPLPARVHATHDPAPLDRTGVRDEDVGYALQSYGDLLDVSADDLHALFKQAEIHAIERLPAELRCRDIMSRDVVAISGGEEAAKARAIMMDRKLLSLPVLDDAGRVQGVITPLDLARDGALARDIASGAVLARADTPVTQLLRPLAGGHRHEVVIVDQDRQLQGIVTQTDLIAAIATGHMTAAPQSNAATSASSASGLSVGA